MTASERPTGTSGDERSLVEWALDLFVYLPAGVVATTLDDMEEMTERGRARVDQQVRNAHVIGRFAVDFGLRRLKREAESFLASRTAPPVCGPAPHATGATTPSSTGPTRAPGAPSRPPSRPRQRVAPPATSRRDPEVDRAIPDYDALSASQVVRRLDGLAESELRAIVRHELATRARRTILHRAEQLLQTPPAAPGAPPAP